MNVSLTKTLEAFVRSKVDSGLYNNASEVVRDALRLLEAKERAEAKHLSWLRAEVQKGIDDFEAGRYGPLDIEAIIAEVDREDEEAARKVA
jgi:antitoxin ParD1/3/4